MMNFYICSLLLMFLRQIFTISSADGISARSQMFESDKGHEAMEARTLSPRRLQIVVQNQERNPKEPKKKEWERPKGNSRQEGFAGY